MIYEYRTYDVAEGRLEELHKRFDEHTIKIFIRHNIKPVAFFAPITDKISTQMQYIVAFDNLEQRKQAWANFLDDKEWQEIHTASNLNGALVTNIKSEVLELTEYSPSL